MRIIDADTHVIETEQTWNYMDKADEHLRPKIITSREPITHKRESPMAGHSFWLVDGRLYMKGGQKADWYPDGSRDLADPEVRIAHMDDLGITTQILIPSFFLGSIIEHSDAELAVAKSYNRWMADVCHSRTNRLRWLVVPSLKNIEATCKMMEEGRDNGAVGVMMRGYEGNITIDDAAFEPIYAKAADLDMAIALHIGNGSPSFDEVRNTSGKKGNIVAFIMPMVVAFNALMMSDIPKRYPALRFGFLEGGSMWLPFVLNKADRFADTYNLKRATESVLSDCRFYITCEAHENLPEILRWAGSNSLVIGSDYGHADTSTELEAHRLILSRDDLPQGAAERMADDNARALYGL
ncbi:MAG: amidohydrolase family protein [Rhodospirillaceae bacterium]